MKRIVNSIRYMAVVLLLLGGFSGYTQESYELSFHSNLTLEGTSTIHDWEMVSKNAEGYAQIMVKDNRIVDITSLSIKMPVVTLKSGKIAMDKNAYKALDADRYPEITFDLSEIEFVEAQFIHSKGTMSVAGSNQLVSLIVEYQIAEDTIRFKGSIPITFTQFEIEPPKALFGTIKTGNDLEITFDTSFISKSKKI